MKKTVNVVAAVIRNEANEILCALRSQEMAIPNMWEFPGGKVEEGENYQEALEREIEEELKCKIKAEDVLHTHTHEYETFIIHLIVMEAKIIEGTPIATEHATLIWLPIPYLHSIKWAPADIPAVNRVMEKEEIAIR